MAARLLDLSGQPAPAELAERLLGREAQAFLRPYLDYTRAGHTDLLALVAQPEAWPFALQTLREAEEACGPAQLKEALAALGWQRLNLGLEARPLVADSLAGGFALVLSAWKAITAAADPWLDSLTPTKLLKHPIINGKPIARMYGNLIQRTIYHYWYHIGENLAIRQELGHASLPQFVGNIDRQAPYRPEGKR